MYYLNVWLNVKDAANVPTVRNLLTQCCQLSRVEPGCARFEVYHSQTQPTRFLLVEQWHNKSDWEAHRTREAVSTIYVPQVLPLVEREPHVSELLT